MIRADGSSGQQQVVTNYPAFSPAWSADGKNLLFMAAGPPTHLLGIWELASGSTHFLAASSDRYGFRSCVVAMSRRLGARIKLLVRFESP